MKKILLLIISLFPFLVMAKNYEIKDINLKLNASDEWIVFTRDNLDNNKDLEDLGLTNYHLINFKVFILMVLKMILNY